MMTFHSGDRQTIGGLTAELIERLKAKGGSVGHIVDTIGYTSTLTPFDAEAMKLELDLMCEEAGVTILFHSRVIAAKVAGDRIAAALDAARRSNAVIVLKGAAAVVATPDGTARVARPSSWLSTAGSSDVLAGLAFGSVFAVLGWNAFVLAASALGFYAIMLL
jgi:NAD(P)H-hydrate repair Nnr-like enzyme with NAD(P)H-hydrate dehydratase domain